MPPPGGKCGSSSGMGTAAVSLYFSAKNVNNVDQGVMLRAVPNGSRIRIHKATDSSIYSLWQTTSAGMGTLLQDGKIRPTVTEQIALESIPQALERLAERHVRGKIVASLNNS